MSDSKHLPALDGIRGMAVLIVVILTMAEALNPATFCSAARASPFRLAGAG
jgi:peptidoglycan/LPS O-acetylase OafA/YrhL